MQIMLNADEMHLLKQVGRQFPQMVELIERLRLAELERMAVSGDDHFRVYKGRTQILTELRQAIRPDLSEKARTS